MEIAYQIIEYLPIKYKNPSDADYFSFLVHSVDQDFHAENFHFAVVALHMIYMGVVYHYIYGIFRADPKRFEYVLIGFHDRLQVKEIDNISWHYFSNENESTIFQFYRAVGISNDQIGNLKAPVKKRNDILHTNGSSALKSFGETTFNITSKLSAPHPCNQLTLSFYILSPHN